MDNHNYNLAHHSIECLAAAGEVNSISCMAGDAIDKFQQFADRHADEWLFGHLGYDLKNEIERLRSDNPDHFDFPDLFFFIPEYVIELTATSMNIGSLKDDHEQVRQQIFSSIINHAGKSRTASDVQSRYTREEYIEVIKKLKHHILRGDCYEINFCQEFYVEDLDVNPVALYRQLALASPSPFSAFYKLNHLFLACSSPERYLKRERSTLLSQPIKGTAGRVIEDEGRDRFNAEQLRLSEKERAENIMVVDLVRNDLSRVCTQGSVKVEELCAIYTFPGVHQMISTITGEMLPDIHWTETIRATFPMGSMTGAPKKRVMELLEEYERSKRGLFSGSIGYINPARDFDFNVVIRSILYNSSTRYLSFQTGSGITFNSDPALEYEECLLKASAIKKALAETNTFH